MFLDNFPYQRIPVLYIRVITAKNSQQERLKSALYLRLDKRKIFKIVKGGPLGFLKIQFVSKYQKKSKGDPFATKKFEKKSHKAEREGLIVPKKWKGGPFCFGMVFQRL